jgi:putative SOS response-associated peptidase YedK
MCGRFTQAYTWREVQDFLNVFGPPQNLQPRYNIAPTMNVDVVLAQDSVRALTKMRWGLCPGWWKKTLGELPATFNARAETVAEKPMFRSAFRRCRCVVPASGFYEWRLEAGRKQPYYITAVDGSILLIAGLWDTWTDQASGETVKSCTLIVTGANKAMRALHDRMPVLLRREEGERWLSMEAGTELLKPAPEDFLRWWPVSRRVNATGRADDSGLIEPLETYMLAVEAADPRS